jgi:hypothetical protein
MFRSRRVRSAAFSLQLAEPRPISLPLIAIEGTCHEDRPSGRWPAICCCWAFLFRTRDRIAQVAAQCRNGRLRRGHRSRRCRPCLVRMAVSARARRFTPAGFAFWGHIDRARTPRAICLLAKLAANTSASVIPRFAMSQVTENASLGDFSFFAFR